MVKFFKIIFIWLIILVSFVGANAAEIKKVSDIKDIDALNKRVYYFDSGAVSQVTFLRGGIGDSGYGIGSGLKIDKIAFFYENGDLKQIQYFKNEKDDKTKFYNIDGSLNQIQYFKNGNDYKTEFYKNSILVQINYYNGKTSKNGQIKSYKKEFYNKTGELTDTKFFN
jgi:hypothetical protein